MRTPELKRLYQEMLVRGSLQRDEVTENPSLGYSYLQSLLWGDLLTSEDHLVGVASDLTEGGNILCELLHLECSERLESMRVLRG